MGPISEPSILAFLHYLSENHPEIKTLANLSEDALKGLILEFEGARNPYDSCRGTHPTRWKNFIADPISGGLPTRKRVAFSLRKLRFKSRFKSIAIDPLERYRLIPNKAIFFYTSEDTDLSAYLTQHWDAIHEMSGDYVDIYDYEIRISSGNRGQYQSFTRDYVQSLSNIPGLTLGSIMDCGLPCLCVWSMESSVTIPLADVTSSKKKLRNRIFNIIKVLARSGALTEWQVDELESIKQVERFGQTASFSRLDPIPCDVFISYTRSERSLADSVGKQLDRRGLVPWFDQGIPCGDRFRSRIRVQMEYAGVSLICLTERAKKSPWVLFESLFASELGTALPVLFGQVAPFDPISSLHHFRMESPEDLERESTADPLLKTIESKAVARRKIREKAEVSKAEKMALVEAANVLKNSPTKGQARRQIRRLHKWKECHPNLNHERANELLRRLEAID
jgi:hypothetical protein